MATGIEFRGSYTAIITPFSADGLVLDLGRLREQIIAQARGGTRGIIVAGTTGESPTLTEDEYETLLSAAVEAGRPLGLQVIAGTGSNNTAHAVHLQQLAEECGADAALSVNPYYTKPTQEGLYRHFVMQADASDLPVMLYNIPGRTGVALTPETVERLAAHPKIRGIKEATGSTDSCGEIAMRCPHLAVLSGDDTMTLPFASVGAVGVVSVVSNVFPERVAELCKAFLAGDMAGALRVHRGIIPIAKAMFLETNPIPVKAAMKLLGRDAGVLRLPMTEARPETVAALRKLLDTVGSA
jgi:4-hydroxy-tetrahydrodipicolinate synthase